MLRSSPTSRKSALAKIFTINRKGVNLAAGVAMAVVLLLARLVVHHLDEQQFLLSVVFGCVFVALERPRG